MYLVTVNLQMVMNVGDMVHHDSGGVLLGHQAHALLSLHCQPQSRSRAGENDEVGKGQEFSEILTKLALHEILESFS